MTMEQAAASILNRVAAFAPIEVIKSKGDLLLPQRFTPFFTGVFVCAGIHIPFNFLRASALWASSVLATRFAHAP